MFPRRLRCHIRASGMSRETVGRGQEGVKEKKLGTCRLEEGLQTARQTQNAVLGTRSLDSGLNFVC